MPTTVEGRDLSPAMHSEKIHVRDKLYFAYTRFQRAVKRDQYKLIEYVVPNKERVTQLFDLQNDPWELVNLAKDDDYQETLKSMKIELKTLALEWGDEEHPMGQAFWSGY